MSTTARPARWWETDDLVPEGRQGRLVSPAGHPRHPIKCPLCFELPVVYNGNYFCDGWTNKTPLPGECTWALAHPARTKRDRDFCDLVGIDYA